MFNSKIYWENRYKKGGHSGKGSYNEFAVFKASILNTFIKEHNITSIIDYGVGDGNQLKLLDTRDKKYIGIDVSPTVLSMCEFQFKNDKTKTFVLDTNLESNTSADLVMSCDVIYHLIEDHVYKEYMSKLFNMSNKYVIIYAPNVNNRDSECVHVRKREFIEFVFKKYTDFNLVKRIKGDVGCPFYIFQRKDTYIPLINRNIIQVTKKDPVPSIVVSKINDTLSNYNYYWYNDETMCEYMRNNKLEEFPNIINKIKSFKKGQHKAALFRYYWLYLNGGIFIDSDLMIEYEMNFSQNTFVSVKTYHKDTNLLFNGFIACNRFNPIVYKALQKAYYVEDNKLDNDNHYLCKQLYEIYQELHSHQNTFLLQEVKENNFKKGVKSYFNNQHVLTHWCYTKKIEIDHTIGTLPRRPVYVSLTSIFQNQDILLHTLKSIKDQTHPPNQIFLYLSEEPYLLDKGFRNRKITNMNLSTFLKNNEKYISVIWVHNIGSYRKLIPILRQKWDEKCIIITIDDDTVYEKRLIHNLVSDYNKHKCVVGYRGFTPKFDNFHNFCYKKHSTLEKQSLYNFLTGKGGILYTPEFFHETKDLIFNREIFLHTCNAQDDIWFYIVRVLNKIECCIFHKKYMRRDIGRKGLYITINSKNDKNTVAFKNTIQKLKELDYYVDVSGHNVLRK